jgi:hypothetical protein
MGHPASEVSDNPKRSRAGPFKVKTTRTPLLIAISALVLSGLVPQVGRSQSSYLGPSGHWTNTVSDPVNAVWDAAAISDARTFSVDLITRRGETNANATCSIASVQRGSGALNGLNSTTVHLDYQDKELGWITVVPFEGRYKVTGNIHSSAGKTRGMIRSAVSGKPDIGGKSRRVNFTHQVNFTFDNAAKTCSTAVKDTGSIPGQNSASPLVGLRHYGPMPLSSFIAGDGSWTLDMTLSTTGKRVVGSAIILLNSGQSQLYSIKGVYKHRNQRSTLVLTGIGLSRGSNLEVIMNADTITKTKGKICGQLVNVTN